jgi:peptidase E
LIAVSAGSIIAGADIGITQFGSEGEENEIGLKNLEGLNLVDFTIYPHFRKELKDELIEATKDYPYKVEYLEDGEAIIVDKEIKRI